MSELTSRLSDIDRMADNLVHDVHVRVVRWMAEHGLTDRPRSVIPCVNSGEPYVMIHADAVRAMLLSLEAPNRPPQGRSEERRSSTGPPPWPPRGQTGAPTRSVPKPPESAPSTSSPPSGRRRRRGKHRLSRPPSPPDVR
jgi:hypothetical protein